MDGVPVPPPYQNEYWYDGGFKKTETVPFGLEMVAGMSHATSEQSTDQAFYYCGGAGRHSAKPFPCQGNEIIMVVVFPQCWDGQLPEGNDTSHMAYSVYPGICPSGFPHALPILEEHIHTGLKTPFNSAGQFVFSLSSGPYYTLHGDFANAWDPAALNSLVQRCINAHVKC